MPDPTTIVPFQFISPGIPPLPMPHKVKDFRPTVVSADGPDLPPLTVEEVPREEVVEEDPKDDTAMASAISSTGTVNSPKAVSPVPVELPADVASGGLASKLVGPSKPTT